MTSVARTLVKTLIACLLVILSSCAKEEAPPPSGVIDREVFIATFVELRDVAMSNPLKILSDEERERILKGHGVTEEQLLAFADAWGGDVGYMTNVWDEVRARMKPLSTAPDAAPDTAL